MAHLDRVLFSCQFCVNFKTKGLPKFLEHSEKVHFGGSMGSLKYQGLFQTNTSYFISLGNYKIKVEKSRKTKLKTCPFCQVSVKKSKLGQHIFYAHDRKCPKCPETKLKTHGEYLKHTKSRIHCTKMKMKCSNCEFETYLSQLFWEHRLLQHPEELIEAIPTPPLTPTLPELPKLQNCPVECCQFTHDYDQEMELKIHFHQVHDSHCPHCGGQFFENDMESHLRTICDPKSLTICHVQGCKTVTKNWRDFVRHRLEAHSKIITQKTKKTQGQKDWPLERNIDDFTGKCEYCGLILKTLEQMFDHISESHDPCCPQCNFVASSEISISEHMANFRHRWDDIKATQCSSWGCVKDFASLQEYWRHRKQFHPGAIYS